MTGPSAATAAVRLAVRHALCDLPMTSPVAAAVSGGADSLALAVALAFVRPGSGALVVDHGLQDGSREVADRAAEQCRSLGLTAEVVSARPGSGQPGGGEGRRSSTAGDSSPQSSMRGAGPEARARAVRYAALDEAAERLGAQVVLLGHTLDDQAETVLLGLARGSGARALAGMSAQVGRYRRPLLELTRATTRTACSDADLVPWTDPHNADPAFARARVRMHVLPVLERALGPGVAQALARSARQAREDADALDALAPSTDEVAVLAALPTALRSRALKRWAELACGHGLTSAHVDALRDLVEHWHGQGPVTLPGGVRAGRAEGRLVALPAEHRNVRPGGRSRTGR